MDNEKLLQKFEHLIQAVISQFRSIDRDTSDDLSQDLRIFLIEEFNKSDLITDIKNIDNYIFIILKRKAIDILRSNKYRREISLNQNTNDVDGIEHLDLIQGNDYEMFQKKIVEDELAKFIKDNLNKKEQNILEMYFEKNMKHQNIGKEMGVSKHTIRRMIKLIIQKLRN